MQTHHTKTNANHTKTYDNNTNTDVVIQIHVYNHKKTYHKHTKQMNSNQKHIKIIHIHMKKHTTNICKSNTHKRRSYTNKQTKPTNTYDTHTQNMTIIQKITFKKNIQLHMKVILQHIKIKQTI